MATTTRPTQAAVRDRLDRVDDPELDESIVELDYIRDLAIDASVVTVELVLPTAWCSPAFAWMMATGARDEVSALPDVEKCVVRLRDHMHEDEINHGVNERLAFEDAFPDAEDGLADVRRTLDEKARMGRQYRAIEALLDAGIDPEQIAALRRADVSLDDEQTLVSLADGGLVVSVSADPVVEYLRKAAATGLVTGPTDRLFATPEGEPISPDEFDRVQHRARLAKTNATGQGSICSALNEARNGVEGAD
ncbi:iron-sulfur cluster assembly protein [Halococcus agarilyticus]|uniref:iron-sulfur cluster assembly protein n=1 Tax=Halococcus agarilyticus TaxID=1232219 RepID=UPI000677E73D|nr:iron-sulfur cluster assembly protein [Halococcus agarilyticus]